MPPKRKKITCKQCGTIINPKETKPNKTWNMVAPMPDKEGRVTITIMATFTCPKCSKTVRAAIQKIKGDEFSGGVTKKEALVNLLNDLTEQTTVSEIAEKMSMNPVSIEKAVTALLKRGELKGELKEGNFVP